MNCQLALSRRLPQLFKGGQIATLVQAAELTGLFHSHGYSVPAEAGWMPEHVDNPPWEELSKLSCTENRATYSASFYVRNQPEMEAIAQKEILGYVMGSLISRYCWARKNWDRKPKSLTDNKLGGFGPRFSRSCCKSTVCWVEHGWDARHLCVSVASGFGQRMVWGPRNALSNLVLYEYGSADPHQSWLVTVSLKQAQRNLGLSLQNSSTFVESRKTKIEKEYGYQQNNNLLGKHQGEEKNYFSKRVQEQIVINWQRINVDQEN